MSKRLTFIPALAAFVVAASGVAFAADMAVKVPSPPPAPVTSWTGWYGGLNAGGTWSDDPVNVTTTNLQFCGPTVCGGALAAAVASAQGATGTLSGKTAGFIGGGQFGYNLQFGDHWVTGFEADIQGIAGEKGTGSTSSTIATLGHANSITTNMSATREIDYLGTARGRLGWLADSNLLLYGTGGLAYGGVKASTGISQVLNGSSGGLATSWNTNSGISETRVGWTAGGGFEWMVGPRWSVKAEYLYYDLGRVSYTGLLAEAITAPGFPPNFFVNNAQSTVHFNGNIVRVGLNYRF